MKEIYQEIKAYHEWNNKYYETDDKYAPYGRIFIRGAFWDMTMRSTPNTCLILKYILMESGDINIRDLIVEGYSHSVNLIAKELAKSVIGDIGTRDDTMDSECVTKALTKSKQLISDGELNSSIQIPSISPVTQPQTQVPSPSEEIETFGYGND